MAAVGMSAQVVATGALALMARHGVLKRRLDAELRCRLPEWFALPDDDLAILEDLVAGGKRLRGTLACLVAEALGARHERALPAALAVEIIQAASLVHDDFVDGDALRRGRPAAWTRLTPRRAVLLADVMFATAIERMARAGARECAVTAATIATMAQGAFREGHACAEKMAYKRITYLKTGSLFAAAAQLGAFAAGAFDTEAQAARDFGMHAGEAYQIADDLADLRRGDTSALAPALAYFAGEAEGQEASTAARMEKEIGLAVERAKERLACFPSGEATRLLAELPGAFACLAS
jgi:geranylgeranyl pyrophosphate synthase